MIVAKFGESLGSLGVRKNHFLTFLDIWKFSKILEVGERQKENMKSPGKFRRKSGGASFEDKCEYTEIYTNIQTCTQIYTQIHKYTNIQIYINRYIYKDK